MPDMDGFELLHKVKSNANINYIPFILLASRVESDNRIKGWNIGADAFLAKPFLMEELYAILLKSNNVAISQVAYAVGFMNPTSFSAVFKRFYGCTPSEYAEEYNRSSQVL